MISFKGRHFPQDIVMTCVRWYVAYRLSYRDIEEMMQERGVFVDHSTLQRWVTHYAPQLGVGRENPHIMNNGEHNLTFKLCFLSNNHPIPLG